MKNIIFKISILLFPVLFLQFCTGVQNDNDHEVNLSLRGDDPSHPGSDCHGEMLPAPCTNFDTILVTLDSLPSYPNCQFTLKVIACKSISSGTEIISYLGYDLVPPFCNDYLNDFGELVLDTLTPQGEINDFISTLDNEIVNALDYYLYAYYGINAPCPLANVIISYVRQSCQSNCLASYYIPDFPDYDEGKGRLKSSQTNSERDLDPENGYFWIKTNCSSTGCCERLVDACYNPATNMLEKVVRYRQFNQNAQNPQAECEEGIPDVLVTDNRISIIRCLLCNFDCPADH